jgi:hypothetical protein
MILEGLTFKYEYEIVLKNQIKNFVFILVPAKVY